jgi:hypothetical protein
LGVAHGGSLRLSGGEAKNGYFGQVLHNRTGMSLCQSLTIIAI